MISNFKLRFGRVPGAAGDSITATPVTVFVGPNNSGKSRVLAEIEQYCRSGNRNAAAAVLDSVEFGALDIGTAEAAIAALKQPLNPGESLQPDHVMLGSRYTRQQVPLSGLLENLQRPSANHRIFCQWFLVHNTLMLNGPNRIGLVNQQTAGDLQQLPQSSFQALFRDDRRRHEVRRIIFEAFSSYFVLDPTTWVSFAPACLQHLRPATWRNAACTRKQ